jgi:hypothetical protein
VSVLCKWEGKERERGRIAGKEDLKKWLLLPLLHVQGKKNNVVPKRNRFVILFVFFFWKKEMNLGVTQKWVMTLDHMLMKLTRVHSSYHYLNILFYEKSSDSYMGC